MPITLVTKEGTKVLVTTDVASCFGMVTSIIDDLEDATSKTELPIPEVDFDILQHIIKFYSDDSAPEEDSWVPWDPNYLSNLEDEVFFKIFVACNYLEATKLLDVCAKWLADIVLECKTPDAIRKRFDITTEPTEEESRMITEECNHIISGYKAV